MKLTSEEKQELLKAQGFNMVDMGMMKMSISRNKALDALMDKIEADPTVSKEAQGQIIVALANKWKANRDVYSQIDAELRSKPELGVHIQVVASANPAALVAAIGQYTPGNMGAALPAKGSYPEAEKRYGVSASAPLSPVAVVAGAAQPSAPAPASPQGQSDNDDDAIWEATASASDEAIKELATADNIRKFADQIAKLAMAKHGVNPATANGFVSTIKRDPKLAEGIATNLQNNPEFVRQLARMAKDKTPLAEPAKSMAQREMNKLMENPQFLADSKYVQGMQQKIQLAEQLKNEGIGGIFKSMFSQFGGGISGMGSVFAGFSGEHQVFSMTRGGGLFPTIMINLDNMRRNEAAAVGWGSANPRDMTALPTNGQFFTITKEKGPDGKEVDKKTPNTIEVTTISGEKLKVIPSVGVLVAGQEAGRFDPDTKQFIAGNWRVPVVTAINESGDPTAIKKITMSPTEFASYQAQVNALSAKSDGRKLEVSPYTAEDARDAERRLAGIQVASVDPQTGVVTQTVAGTTVRSGPVRSPNGAVANDRDLELQG